MVKLIAFEIIATLDMYKIKWEQTGKESKQSVLTRQGKERGGVVIWCKQSIILVNFRLKYKDINKSNKRQTYTHPMGVLGVHQNGQILH